MFTTSLSFPWLILSTVCAAIFASLLACWLYIDSKGSWHGLPSKRVFALGMLLPLLLFTFAVLTLSANVPYWDDYDAILEYLNDPPQIRITNLFAFHNEHIIMFVRLVAELIFALNGQVSFIWMILIGNLLYLGYVYLLLKRVSQQGGGVFARLWTIPCTWALLSILMYENSLWALTSLQNQAVMLFALLSLWCLELGARLELKYFLLSVFFAFLSSFTSGSGLLVWICLAGMWLKIWCYDFKRLEVEPLARKMLIVKGLLLLGCGGVCFSVYMHGLARQAEKPLTALLERPFALLAYAVTLCGASAHFIFLVIPLGVLVMVLTIILGLRLVKIKDNTLFFFVCFLVLNVATASIFRGGELGVEQALSYRYRVVAVSMVVCVGGLLYSQFFTSRTMLWTLLCAGVTFAVVFLNLSAYLLAYPQLHVRSNALRRGILAWPADVSGLVYPDPKRAAAILDRSSQKGVYRFLEVNIDTNEKGAK